VTAALEQWQGKASLTVSTLPTVPPLQFFSLLNNITFFFYVYKKLLKTVFKKVFINWKEKISEQLEKKPRWSWGGGVLIY
jgi:vesicle coat complex subunit